MRKIVICDDQPAVQAQIRSYLELLGKQINESFHTICLSSGEELLRDLPPDTDILLLDIQMGPISGMDAANALRRRYRELCVIFITSQVQYALEGYSVHAFGFLCKPLQYGQFRQQMEDALAQLDARKGFVVTLKTGGETFCFNCNEIYYIESWGHTVSIAFQKSKQKYSANLGLLEEQLRDHGFYRCHKSILVNLRLIERIGQSELVMINGDTIPLSRYRRKDFLVAFAQQVGGGL